MGELNKFGQKLIPIPQVPMSNILALFHFQIVSHPHPAHPFPSRKIALSLYLMLSGLFDIIISSTIYMFVFYNFIAELRRPEGPPSGAP